MRSRCLAKTGVEEMGGMKLFYRGWYFIIVVINKLNYEIT